MKINLTLAVLASVITILSGCSSLEERTHEVAAAQDHMAMKVEQLRKTSNINTTEAVGGRQKMDGAWVTNATAPMSVKRRPPAFDTNIQLTATKPLSTSEVASRITMLTGMPVTLAPDVFRGPAQAPVVVGFNGSVEELLNVVCGANRLSQRLEGKGVTLYRYETAVLRVKRKPGKLTTQTQIGVSGSSSASSSGTTSDGEMSASITGQSSFDPWAELSLKIKAVLTPEGRVQEASATSTIIVTDVPEAVELAKKIVEDDNKLATTAINVKVEIINVTNEDDQNLGINWNMVFTELENANPLAAVTFAAPGSLASGSVGNFKVAVPNGSTSRFANSDFLIQALNKVGKAQTLLRRDFTTIHNVPSGFSRTNSKSYRAKTTAAPASSTGNGTGQVGVDPGQVTTGTRFIVTPTYLGDGEFAVELAYNDSFLKELVKLGVGQQEIDAPDVDGNQMFNITTAKLGETSILNAFEVDTNKAANQGLTSGTTSQMSSGITKTRIYMLVTVTGGPQ